MTRALVSDARLWESSSKQNLCPVCHKDHNCKISHDQSAVWCGRAEAPRQNSGGQFLWKRHQWNPFIYEPAPLYPEDQNSRPQHSVSYERIAKKITARDEFKSKKNDRIESLRYLYDTCENQPLDKWANHLGIPVVGLKRAKARACYARLIVPEFFSIDEGRLVANEAYHIRHWNESVTKLTYGTRGVNRYGSGKVVHAVEGFSDFATFAAMDMTTVSRPSNLARRETVTVLVGEDRDLVAWGENDVKEDGRWPGRDGADSLAACFTETTRRGCWKCFPPAAYKDAREWWRGWCEENAVDPAFPTKEQRSTFRGVVEQWVIDHGEYVDVPEHVRRSVMEDLAGDARSAYEHLLHSCRSCGVYYAFAEGKKEPKAKNQGGYTFTGFKVRCKCSNTCSDCAAIREADFGWKLLKAWIHTATKRVFRFVVQAAEKSSALRKIRRRDGEYAWMVHRDGTVVIYSSVQLANVTGELMDTTQAGQAEHLGHDVVESDRSVRCRLGTSRGWYWEETEDEGDKELIPLGVYKSYALDSVASEWQVTVSTNDVEGHRDYIEIVETSLVGELKTVQDFYADVKERGSTSLIDMHIRNALKRRRSQLPIQEDQGLLGNYDHQQQMHLPFDMNEPDPSP